MQHFTNQSNHLIKLSTVIQPSADISDEPVIRRALEQALTGSWREWQGVIRDNKPFERVSVSASFCLSRLGTKRSEEGVYASHVARCTVSHPIPPHIIPSHYACSRSKAGEGSLTETADPAER